MPARNGPADGHARSDDDGNYSPRPAAASRQASQEQPPKEHAARLHDAERLLGELHAATKGLGDALTTAGFPPPAWRAPEARLSTLSARLPTVTLGALMARLTAFAQDTESIWLAGDGAMLDAFVHEVRVLAAAVEPLSALAKRQRTLAAATARDQRPLKQTLAQALQDGRVATQLERLVHTLHQLLELAPQLAPIPPGFVAGAWRGSAPGALDPESWRGEPEDGAAAPLWLPEPVGRAGLRGLAGQAGRVGRVGRVPIPQGSPRGRRVAHRLGSWLLRGPWPGWPRQRRARVVLAVGLAASVLVLVMSGTVALLHGLQPSPQAGLPMNQLARATATQGRNATASPTGSTATASPTPVPDPAQLAVSPTSVVLPCSGTSVTLTVRDTGGEPLTWQGSVSGNATLSVTSGTVAAHSEATVSAHATRTQHGPGAIVFTSKGGKATVSFKVSCH
jgi:hypothetical protein